MEEEPLAFSRLYWVVHGDARRKVAKVRIWYGLADWPFGDQWAMVELDNESPKVRVMIEAAIDEAMKRVPSPKATRFGSQAHQPAITFDNLFVHVTGLQSHGAVGVQGTTYTDLANANTPTSFIQIAEGDLSPDLQEIRSILAPLARRRAIAHAAAILKASESDAERHMPRLYYLSYRWSDGISSADDLRRYLRSRGVAVWSDLRRVAVGDDLDEEMERGIRESNGVAIVLTPDFPGTGNALKELKWAMERKQGDPTFRIAVLRVGVSHTRSKELLGNLVSAETDAQRGDAHESMRKGLIGLPQQRDE